MIAGRRSNIYVIYHGSDVNISKKVPEKLLYSSTFLLASVPESQEVPEASRGRGRGPVEVDACRCRWGVGTAEMDSSAS